MVHGQKINPMRTNFNLTEQTEISIDSHVARR